MNTKCLPILIALAVPAAAHADHARGHTTFTVRIENVSTTETLRSKGGLTAPAPNSPGVWLVSRGGSPLFTRGKLDMGRGLEAQAEDGDPAPLAAWVGTQAGVAASGVFDTPLGDATPGPALPGKAYEFVIDATPGMKLHLATMFGQSNDWFYAPKENGIALFDKQGRPASGDLTGELLLWDAGTEVDEEPGFGANQGPRQAKPNTGVSEKKKVALVNGRYPVPPVEKVLKVTITPARMTAGH